MKIPWLILWMIAVTVISSVALAYALTDTYLGSHVLGVSYTVKDVPEPEKVKAGDVWETGAVFREGTVFETVNTGTSAHEFYRVGKGGSSRIKDVHYVIHRNHTELHFETENSIDNFDHLKGYELLLDYGDEYSATIEARKALNAKKNENSVQVVGLNADKNSYVFPNQGQDWYRHPPFPAGNSSAGPRIFNQKFGFSFSLSRQSWRRFGWPEWKRWRYYVGGKGKLRTLEGTLILWQKVYTKTEFANPEDLAVPLDTPVVISTKGIVYTQLITMPNSQTVLFKVTGTIGSSTSVVTLRIPLNHLRAYFSSSRVWHKFTLVNGSPSYLKCNYRGWINRAREQITVGFGREFDFISS